MKPETPHAKRDDIQGLRGVAVLAVVTYHAGHVLPGGFAGVDIFFVISGYLITRILLKSLNGGTFSLRDFYRRRVRRLFPALFVVLAVALVAGLAILPPKLLKELAYTQFFTTLFTSNFAFARLSDYFDPSAMQRPLLHTWSLGVEEQFYLLYPLFLLAIWRFARRWLWLTLAGTALISLILGQLWVLRNPQPAFFQPLPRAFELLTGALCVGLQSRFSLNDTVKRALSLLGLALIAASLVFLRDSLPFPGLWAVPPCAGAALLLLSPDGWGNRFIAAPPFVVVGDMSYSLYLWHWPLLVYVWMLFGPSAWVTVPAVMAAFVLAWLSRRYVEKPFLHARKHVWTAAASAMAVSLVLALLVFGAKGLPQRFNAGEQAAFAASDDFNHDRHNCHLGKGERIDYAQTCTYGDPSAAPGVAVWGDSHGAELSQALGAQLAVRHLGLRQITASACPPSVGYAIAYNPTCQAHNADMLAHLSNDPRLTTIILVANYLRYQDAGSAHMLSGLELSALDLQAAHKQVVIVYPLPIYAFDPPSQTGLAMRLGHDPRGIGMTTAQYQKDNGRIIAELDAFTTAHHLVTVKPADVLCDAIRCHVYDPAIGVLYFNGEHLSLKGAGLVAAQLTTIIAVRPAG